MGFEVRQPQVNLLILFDFEQKVQVYSPIVKMISVFSLIGLCKCLLN